MPKLLKSFFAFGILICLFLPLSQCSSNWLGAKPNIQGVELQQSNVDNAEKSESFIIKMNTIPENVEGWLILGAFICPLLFCLYLPQRSKLKVLFLVLQTASISWLLYVAYLLVYTLGHPLYGGYLLTLFSVAYFVCTLFEWHQALFKKLYGDKVNGFQDA